MKQTRKHYRAAWIGMMFLITAACVESRDPAKETPVEPEPGLYEVTLSGAGLMKAGDKDRPRSTCLHPGNRDSFPHTLVKNYYALHYTCRTNPLPRVGNKIAGDVTCAADPKLAAGVTQFSYSGAVASENIDISVQMKFDAAIKEDAMSKEEAAQLRLGMKAFEQMRFVIMANRIGDC